MSVSQTKVTWTCARYYPGLIVDLPGLSMYFDQHGRLNGYTIGGADPEPGPDFQMKIARVEWVGEEMHLVFAKSSTLLSPGSIGGNKASTPGPPIFGRPSGRKPLIR